MMACAELLAVCLLSADRGPAPRRQPLPIFHDVSTAGRVPSRTPVPPPGLSAGRAGRRASSQGAVAGPHTEVSG